MTELSAPAPAKINLTLDILGRRPDGYHELRTVLQTLELADRVRVREAGEMSIEVTGPFASGAPADETNLAYRAAATLASLCRRNDAGIAIQIEKHIPPASGLGGGASDAATVLRLLQRAWPEAREDHLIEAANAIGSDEAFFLQGGTAVAGGRGESVAPIHPLPPHDVVLFVPITTIEAKTATLFRAVAEQAYDSGERTFRFLDSHPSTLGPQDLSNAFERVAFDVFSGLRTLRNRIEHAIGSELRLVGAGPALFWIGGPGEGPQIASATAGVSDCHIIATRTVGSQWAP